MKLWFSLVAMLVAVHIAGAERPNFLFILTDDQAPETLSAYGNGVCKTPNLDRLAAEGMTMDGARHMGAYVGAVCLPSRTMIMTGRTLWHTPGKGNPNKDNPDMVPENLPASSLPAVFNNAGYATFRSCKSGNTYREANELFEVTEQSSFRGSRPSNSVQWHVDNALRFLDQRTASGDDRPFLMYLGFARPHDPRNAPEKYLAKYHAVNEIGENAPVNPDAPPLPANYLPKHPFPHGHDDVRDEVRVQGVMARRDEATVRNEIGRNYACIDHIDAQLGRVLAQLEESGQLDNTYIIFTSDHGMSVGRHGLMGKQNLYEHTWRVPFIARGPGIEAGSRAMGNFYLLDVMPTLCDLAGIEIPATVEGLSIRPVLEGGRDTMRDVMYGAYSGGAKPGMRCVKHGNWKLIKYDALDGQIRETQLFNLEENPSEFLKEHHEDNVIALTGHRPEPQQTNLADDPRFADKRNELEALLMKEQKRLHDPFPLWIQQ